MANGKWSRYMIRDLDYGGEGLGFGIYDLGFRDWVLGSRV